MHVCFVFDVVVVLIATSFDLQIVFYSSSSHGPFTSTIPLHFIVVCQIPMKYF